MPTIAARYLAGAQQIEVYYCPETERSPRTPLAFVHGAYVGAWCWSEHFLPWFAARGFPVYALSLRGHGASAGRERLHACGLAEYAEDVALLADSLPRPPVLVGHSMGALVVQKHLERRPAPAAVFACPVPPFGLLPSTFSLALLRPALFAEIQALAAGRSRSREALAEALAEALLAGPLAAEVMERLFSRMQGESRRALADMAWWGLPQYWRLRCTELLVVAAARDALIAPVLVESSARLLGAECRSLEGLGHALMLDARWERAAEALLGWFESRGL